MTATTTVFQGIGQTLDNATESFVVDVATTTIDTIYPLALVSVTLFIVLYGYAIICGFVESPVMSGLMKAGKILIISAFALHADMYLNGVVVALKGLEEGLTFAFSGGSGVSIYEALDSSLSKGLELILQCKQKAQSAGITELGTSIGWWIVALVIAAGFGLVVVVGGISLLLSTFYLQVLFAIGPVFIFALMFPISARFFESWFGFVLNHILIVALTAVVLTLSVTIYNNEIAKVMIDSDQNLLGVALELLVIAAILYAVCKGVVGVAAALAGGLTMSVMGVGGLGRTAAHMAKGAKSAGVGAAHGATAAGRGAANAAQWLYRKWSGNTVSPTQPRHAPMPAYRQHVLDTLRGRPK